MLYSVVEHGNFLNIDISQGSVATCLRCGRIFHNVLIFDANLLSLSGKHFENRSTFNEVKGKSIVASF